MKNLTPLFVLFFAFLLDSCSQAGKAGNDESGSPDSLSAGKKEMVDNAKQADANSTTTGNVTQEEIAVVPENYKFLQEGSWLARNCFPPKKFEFTIDMTLTASDNNTEFSPQWTIQGDTLRITDSKSEAYKIVSYEAPEIHLKALQQNRDYLNNCGDDDIVLHHDHIIDTVKTSDLVGNWGNGESLFLKEDGTFQYDAPPTCSTSGTWKLLKGNLVLSFEADPCLSKYIARINNFELTAYTLSIKTQSQTGADYRILYR